MAKCDMCGNDYVKTFTVTMDGREHVRQRRLISAGFTPRMVARLETQTREWAVTTESRPRLIRMRSVTR